jgi:hypothetical protein
MKHAFFTRQNTKREKDERAGQSPARLFLIAVLILCTAFLTVPGTRRLVVERDDTAEILAALPVEEGEMVRIGFTHSVNLSPVWDCYEIQGNEMILRATVFQTYGAGIPILDDGLGTGFRSTPEGFEITGIDLPRTDIPIQLQTVPDHTLYYRQTPIRLLELAGSGSLIHIGIRRISLLKRMSIRPIAPYL